MKLNRDDPRILATMAVMTALVFVVTRFAVVPIGIGYFNFSDVIIYFTAFTFGPWVALFAGGIGTALADISAGYASFAPLTLLAHGLQGWAVGWIGQHPKLRRMLSGWALGSLVMVGLYFAGEALFPIWGGPPQAITEVPGNILQNIGGGLIGILLAIAVRRAYPPVLRWGTHQS